MLDRFHVPLASLTTAAALAAAALTSASGQGAEAGGVSDRTSGSSHVASTSRTGPGARTPEHVLAHMTLGQQVGQLFMVGAAADRPDPRAERAIGELHVGSVVLVGKSRIGTAGVARLVRRLQARTTRSATLDTGLLVAVDQEGGQVQHLVGPGFSAMPSALAQGHWTAATLQRTARAWAGQLRRAGVNVDLGPVADTVPRSKARSNAPIGALHRNFGYRPALVARQSGAFVSGMRSGFVSTTLKHFPGLGRVRGNTDFAADVVDRTTKRHDAYLEPFRAGIRAGAPFVMMSSASYPRLDPHRLAVFSPTVIGTVLRGDLGFRGVVVSDSLDTVQVRSIRPGKRAVRFVHAGGDLILITGQHDLREMYAAVLSRARQDASFRSKVKASALRVLRAKAERGLLER